MACLFILSIFDACVQFFTECSPNGSRNHTNHPVGYDDHFANCHANAQTDDLCRTNPYFY
jgi:hypothetical protein